MKVVMQTVNIQSNNKSNRVNIKNNSTPLGVVQGTDSFSPSFTGKPGIIGRIFRAWGSKVAVLPASAPRVAQHGSIKKSAQTAEQVVPKPLTLVETFFETLESKLKAISDSAKGNDWLRIHSDAENTMIRKTTRWAVKDDATAIFAQNIISRPDFIQLKNLNCTYSEHFQGMDILLRKFSEISPEGRQTMQEVISATTQDGKSRFSMYDCAYGFFGQKYKGSKIENTIITNMMKTKRPNGAFVHDRSSIQSALYKYYDN